MGGTTWIEIPLFEIFQYGHVSAAFNMHSLIRSTSNPLSNPVLKQ